MAKEECLSKEKIIDQIGILTSLEKLKYCIDIKTIKRLKLNLRFMLPSVSSLFL